jgi:N utilization substance protein B
MAIQVLYQVDVVQLDTGEALRLFCEHFEAPESIRDFALQLINGVHQNLEVIDTLLRQFSEHWRLERMPAVDRNILRLAVYELVYRPDIPDKVTINEAVDLGKKYGAEDSGSFINGILDSIRLHLEGSKVGGGSLDIKTAPADGRDKPSDKVQHVDRS